MADTEIRSSENASQDGGARNRSKAETNAQQGGGALETEPRSFAEAGQAAAQAARRTADAGFKAAQDAARRAPAQAADLWRSSLDPLAQMQNEFSRWFELMWREASGGRLHPAQLVGDVVIAPLLGAPSADLHETDDAVELTAELPGMTAAEVSLTLRGDALILSGQRVEQGRREEGAYRIKERRSGSFERTFVLPAGIDRKHIEARFDNGLLKVHIPKSAQAAPEGEPIQIKG
jgi:HSP20 family protein